MNVRGKARVTATFRVRGDYTDPDTLTFEVVAPNGTKTAVVYPAANTNRVAAGQYTIDVDCTAAGPWHVNVISTGAAPGSETVGFVVFALPGDA